MIVESDDGALGGLQVDDEVTDEGVGNVDGDVEIRELPVIRSLTGGTSFGDSPVSPCDPVRKFMDGVMSRQKLFRTPESSQKVSMIRSVHTPEESSPSKTERESMP